MKIITLAICFTICSLVQAQTRVDTLSQQLKNPNGTELMVVSNQGDWHGTTSNSLHALQKAYEKGAKIAFVNLQQTKDGEIILFESPTVEKVTTATGKVSEMTLKELRALPLKDYHEGQGYEAIPTLAEALDFAKSRILLEIQPGKLTKKVQEIIKQKHAENGVIYAATAPAGMMCIPVVNLDDTNAKQNLEKALAQSPVAVEIHFKSDDNALLKSVIEQMKGKCRVCVNTTQKGLAGDRQDASPRDDADKVWGSLIQQGATLILTDQTKGLMNYLKDEEEEKILSQKCEMTDWIDPINATPRNTEYVLYPTTQRGEGTQGSFMIYLPMEYERDSTKRYPVIYYFHGMHDSQRDGRWLIKKVNEAIMRHQMDPVIIVSAQAMPQGYYMNGNTEDPKCVTGPIEDVIIKDLIPYVDSHYRTIANRNGRALEGFSMGGRGALMLGFKHVDMFCAVSSVSGAVVHWDEEHMKYALEGACGDYENPASKVFFESNHPIVFAQKNAKEIITSGMKLRFFVGTADHLQPIVTNFTEELKKLGISYTFKVVPEAHHKPLEVFAPGVNDYDFSFWNNVFKQSENTAKDEAGKPAYCVFTASDRHENGEGNNLTALVKRVIVGTSVCPSLYILDGDNVGGRGNMKPVFSMYDLMNEIKSGYAGEKLPKFDTFFTYGSHDDNIQEGYAAFNAGGADYDGFHVYGISYAQMIYATDPDTTSVKQMSMVKLKGPSKYSGIDRKDPNGYSATTASVKFKQWASQLNDTLPIIIVSHVPIHADRGDNLGASIWVKAMNEVGRNHPIMLLFAHNHSIEESDEENGAKWQLEQRNYLIEPGKKINVQGVDRANIVSMKINFTYMNAGYIKLGYCHTLTFQDENKDGAYDCVVVVRHTLNGEKTVHFGLSGVESPYVWSLKRNPGQI